jgi:molybdenum cofactor cytidylyltransferase
MRFEGAVTIEAPRERVWAFLTDPEAVGQCAPGLESLEVIAPKERFRAVASAGFGTIKVRFVTDVEWLDLAAPTRASMKVHGTAPGSAVDARSSMVLSDGQPGRTDLHWVADVNVVGTIASLAARLMSGVAQRLTDAFFDAVRRRIESEGPMVFGPVPVEQAEGAILGHNVAGADGARVLRKGRPLSAADVATLAGLGRRVVYVARLGPGDVDEDRAALRVAQAALGPGLRLSAAASGRVNVIATGLGVFRVDPERLARLNGIEGVTLATLRTHATAQPGQVVATVKVIPFALPEATVRQAEAVAGEGSALLALDILAERSVALVLIGSPAAQARVRLGFEEPLRSRVSALGSSVRAVEFIPLEDGAGEASLAEALRRQADAGAALIVIAGETAIVDRHDIAPRAIERAGGEVVGLGAPVDPGNLLLLAHLGATAILGAPGCARSRKTNVVDFLLPRLLAGDRLARADVVALGHGGLLEDVPDRPMPRSDLA